MLFRRMYDDDLAQACYLIGCQQTGEAILIDAERDVDRYLEEAAREDLRIVAVAETHIHADFLAGTRELAERTGAKVLVSAKGGPDWQYGWLDAKKGGGSYDAQRLSHGDRFQIGKIDFVTVHTPGHTPEHICFQITDRGGGASDPIGMVTGDFVFVGSLGRPDLLETAAGIAGAQEASAQELYCSAKDFMGLPDYLQVWPAHGAGSACGKALGAIPQSTVGYEKRFNPALLQLPNEQGFIDYMLEGQPEPPYYFARMKRQNRDGAPVLGDLPAPESRSAAELAKLALTSDVVVDLRSWHEFRNGHLPGSLWSPLGPNFSRTTGSYITEDQNIHVIVDPSQLDRVVRGLVRIGLDRVVSHCAPESLGDGSLSLATTPEIDCTTYRDLLPQGKVQPLDVRRMAEFELGHIDGSVNIAHTRLLPRLDEVPRDRPLVICCRTGIRSAIACAYLERQGLTVTNLAGGFEAWQATKPSEVSAK